MISSLRKHVSRVVYKLEISEPDWDTAFEDRGGNDYNSKRVTFSMHGDDEDDDN
jgi:hypothetical protein